MKIIISIPAYNEEQDLPKVIKEIKDVMSKEKYDYKILVLNDGSKDNTEKVAKDLGAIVYSHPRNFGLAETFRSEVKRCIELKADIIVHTDADGQYPAEFIPKLIEKINQGYDLVLGSRFLGKIEKMPIQKKLGNKAFSKVISQITKTKITDAQTGFRAFTRELAEKTQIISTFTYTQEQIIRAVKEKFRVTEIPINTRFTRKSKLMKNIFHFATQAWINIFRIYRDYEPLKFFGIIGSIFLLAGLILGIWLLSLFITTGKVGHIPASILTMLLIITGIQILIFGFLADMHRK